MIQYGYAGKILRVNLSDGTFSDETLDNDFMKKYIGGVGFGPNISIRKILIMWRFRTLKIESFLQTVH